MDKTKSPGIRFERIDLLECNVGHVNVEAKLAYNLSLVELTRQVTEKGDRLMVMMGFDLMKGIKEPPFSFHCLFLAHYAKDQQHPNMDWNEFTDAMALAHAMPFVRELLSNITNRLPLPVLMLSPVNVFELIEKYKAAKESPGKPAATRSCEGQDKA